MTFEARKHEVGQSCAHEAALDRHAESAQVLARETVQALAFRLPARIGLVGRNILASPPHAKGDRFLPPRCLGEHGPILRGPDKENAMMRTAFACAALLLTTAAWAAEPEGETAPAQPTEAQAPAMPEVAPQTAPAASTQVEPETTASTTAIATPPSEPEPYTGWGRGVRAPMYVNLMLSAGALGEDGDNRLTTRDSKILEGAGGLFRVGAVLGEHHRLGGRFQSFVRPTKKVVPDPSSTAATTDSWGAVTFGYAGPEYLYTSDVGLYGGASVGVAGEVSSRKVDNGNSDDDPDVEKASAGVAGMLSLGYEWRANKWFALNAEVFGGLYHGVDDNEDSMNGSLFGVAMGVGF